MLKIGSRVVVHAYKHDGTLYRSWEKPHVVYDDGEVLVLYNKFVRVYDCKQRPRFSKDDTFWIFYRDRWFNVQVTVREPNVLSYYINVAGPHLVEDNAVKYVDYDLDFKIPVDGSWKEVDMGEFRTNAKRYAYPPAVLTAVRAVEASLVSALRARQPLVDHDVFCRWFETVIRPMRGKFITNTVGDALDTAELARSINRRFAYGGVVHG